MDTTLFPGQAEDVLQNLGAVRAKPPAAERPIDDAAQKLADEIAARLQATTIAAAEELEQAYQNARIMRRSIDETYAKVQIEHAWRKLRSAIAAYKTQELPAEVNAAISRAALERPRTQERIVEFRPIKLKLDPFPHDFEAHINKKGMQLYYRSRGPRTPLVRVVDDRAIAKAYLAIMKMSEVTEGPTEGEAVMALPGEADGARLAPVEPDPMIDRAAA